MLSYNDLSKALDIVDHKLFKKKCSTLCVSNPLLSWVGSFLTDKTQDNILNQVSAIFNVLSCIPPGGYLSSLLFSLFINNFKSMLHLFKYFFHADNLKMYNMVVNVVKD